MGSPVSPDEKDQLTEVNEAVKLPRTKYTQINLLKCYSTKPIGTMGQGDLMSFDQVKRKLERSERVLTQNFPISTTILPNAGKGEISESLNELSGNGVKMSQNVPPYPERKPVKKMMICHGTEQHQRKQQSHYRRDDTIVDLGETCGEHEHHLAERDLGVESAWICDHDWGPNVTTFSDIARGRVVVICGVFSFVNGGLLEGLHDLGKLVPEFLTTSCLILNL
ncbi:MAG: hypothetical protein GY820_07425, partial [Gammaproteobacteria bacterium]|nr:hypothetical protein [Gammaproteobacteria bacterium]